MLKPLSAEGRFESGLDAIVRDKTYAFTAIVNDPRCGGEPPYRLGVAVANEPGYYPVPVHWCNSDDYPEMEAHAKELNAALGLDERAASIIVASSMGAQDWKNWRRHGKR